MTTRWQQGMVVTRQKTTSNTMTIVIVTILVAKAESTCNSDQYNSCLNAGECSQSASAVEGSMTSLAGGGVCQSKPYIQFTHVCSVRNYMPTVDYCCCMLDSTSDGGRSTLATPGGGRENTIVMCCRYHQDWNHFRCQEPDDVVHSTPMISSVREALLPTGMLITLTTVGSVLIVAICIVCCIKCCCYRYEGDSQLWCCHYCVQDGGDVGVANRDWVKPAQTSSAGEVFSEDDVCPCYELPAQGHTVCPQHGHQYNDHPYPGHPTHPYHLHYHHHHQQQQQQRRGMCNHPTLDRTVHMTSPATYDGDLDHTQCVDNTLGGTGALSDVTRTCCVAGGMPCAGPRPPSTCVCSTLFSPTGCGLNPQALAHHAPTSWCTCTEQLYTAALRGCTRRTSFYRRHIAGQQQTSSRSNSTYSRLSRRHSRTKAGSVSHGGYYLPHETACSTSESSNDLCGSAIDTATSQQLVPMASDVIRKDGDVIIDGCGGKYAAGYLHWQAVILQPTTATSFLFTSPSCSPHAPPQSGVKSTVTEDKDVAEIVASAPPEQTELDDVGNVDEGIDSGIETILVADQT